MRKATLTVMALAMLTASVTEASPTAKVVVYRPGWRFPFTAFPVFLDGQLIGSNRPKTFVAVRINAGRHTLLSGADHHTFTAQPGGVYYYRQHAHIPWADPLATSEIERVSEVEAQRDVAICKPASVEVTNDD
jgi:hypothetical protein